MRLNRDQGPDRSAGFSDLVNYGVLVSDGVMLCRDGSFLAGWLVSGSDMSAWSQSEMAYHANQLNGAFSALGHGWAIWYDIVAVRSREYCDADRDAFPDEVTAQIDAERREMFEGDDVLTLERKQALFLHYTPDNRIYRKAAALFVDDAGKGMRRPASQVLDEEIAHFEARLSDFEAVVRSVARIDRLMEYEKEDEPGTVYSDLVNYLDMRVGGRSREVAIVDSVIYLDGVFAYPYVDTAYPVRIGDDYVLAVSIDGFPPAGRPEILAGLARLECEYVWSTRMIMQGRERALAEIAAYERGWGIQVYGFLHHVLRSKSGRQSRDALEMQDDALDAEHRISSGRTAAGFYSSVLLFRGPDLEHLQQCVAMATETAALAGSKFHLRPEGVNAMEAILGSLPGHVVQNVRRPLMNARNFSDLVSWSTLWRGPEAHPNRLYPEGSGPLMYAFTRDREPFRLVPFDGDLGNVVGIGPSGSGKTVLLNAMNAQEARYPGMRIWDFDFKYGMYTLAKECGWQHYDLGMPGALSLCPLGRLEDDEDVSFAKTWLENRFMSRTDRHPTARQSRTIGETVDLMRGLPDMRSLSDFCAFVQDMEVRNAIRHFSIDGAAGSLLDAREDVLDDDANVVFELEEFVHTVDDSILSATYSFLFRRFLRGLRVDRPSSLYMDEAHYGLRDKFFVPMLDVAMRTIRSKNGRISLFTQSIKEAVENGIGPLLTEASGMQVYLPNAKAADRGTDRYPGSYDYYKMMGLSDEDIEIIRKATKKRDYYVVTPHGKQVIDLGISGTLLEIVQRPVVRQELRRAVNA